MHLHSEVYGLLQQSKECKKNVYNTPPPPDAPVQISNQLDGMGWG